MRSKGAQVLIKLVKEIREIREVRDLKEAECFLRARKPSLNSLNSLSLHLKARKPSLNSLNSLISLSPHSRTGTLTPTKVASDSQHAIERI